MQPSSGIKTNLIAIINYGGVMKNSPKLWQADAFHRVGCSSAIQ